MIGDSTGGRRDNIEDLATEPMSGLGFANKVPLKYNRERQLDTIRARVAFCLIGLLALIVIGVFGLVFTLGLTRLSLSDVRSLAELLITPVVALVGAATGFYFGAQAAARPGRDTEE